MRRVRADTYSKSKYASVISQAGGWDWFQRLLGALQGVARKHGTSIANVASRWVLDQPQARLLRQSTFLMSHPGEEGWVGCGRMDALECTASHSHTAPGMQIHTSTAGLGSLGCLHE